MINAIYPNPNDSYSNEPISFLEIIQMILIFIMFGYAFVQFLNLREKENKNPVDKSLLFLYSIQISVVLIICVYYIIKNPMIL